jgi:hypothetical protein
MAKQSGLGDNFYLGGYDISGDTASLGNVGGGPAVLDVTGIDKSANERIGGLRDGRMEWTSHFNPAAAKAHAVLSSLPTTSRIGTYCRGTALGSPGAGLVGKQVDYAPSRGNDGAMTIAVSIQASDGAPLEWGVLGTAGKRTDTAATNGTSVDNGAAGTDGLVAYLHVFAFTGTSVTVKIQSSSDNGTGDAFTDITGGAFTAATTIGAERIATATGQAVERYLRVVTTGTFTSATFAVVICRRPEPPA